jgi:hypothetical protein
VGEERVFISPRERDAQLFMGLKTRLGTSYEDGP